MPFSFSHDPAAASGNTLVSVSHPTRPPAHFTPSIAAAVVGAILALGIWYAISYREDRLAELEFRTRANNQALLLENGIRQYLGKVEALHALLESDEEVKRDEFDAFTASILRDQTALLAMSWIPRVTREHRAAHEIAGMAQGLPDYHLKSAVADGDLVRATEANE